MRNTFAKPTPKTSTERQLMYGGLDAYNTTPRGGWFQLRGRTGLRISRFRVTQRLPIITIDGQVNKCTDCGHCCVIFTHVAITEGEAKLKGIKTERAKADGCRVKRKEVFWGQLGYTVFICWYFDLDTRLCSIYYNRPETCRKYNYCDKDKRVQGQWLKLMRREGAACLWN